METSRVCKITYKSLWGQAAKIFHIKPLKLFAKNDTLYLHAQMAKSPGKIYKTPKFDPLLVIHRIENLKVTEVRFQFPENFDFEKTYNQTFGVIKDDLFQIKIEFSGHAAKHVKERIWSHDQIIKEKKDEKIELTFTATSIVETLSWVMSFGHEARVIEPDWFVGEVKDELQKAAMLYY